MELYFSYVVYFSETLDAIALKKLVNFVKELMELYFSYVVYFSETLDAIALKKLVNFANELKELYCTVLYIAVRL